MPNGKSQKKNGIKAVVIAGGTGGFTVLSALKNYVTNITAVVNMVDDGGSTGILRDELGVLPTGDVRQSLVALSSSSQIMRELFNYRFSSGTFAGHPFGNIFLTALEKITGSFAEAVVTASKILDITGAVIPVTTENVRECVRLPDGKILRGQGNIADHHFKPGEKRDVFLEPDGKLNPLAHNAILEADLIIIAPGNLYTSIIPTLLMSGMAQALKEAKGKKIYVCNLMTQEGQTDGLSVAGFAEEIERRIGEGTLDYVVYNNVAPSKNLLSKYAQKGEVETRFDAKESLGKKYQAIGDDLISETGGKLHKNDPITGSRRTLIRHDGDRLARLLMKIYFS